MKRPCGFLDFISIPCGLLVGLLIVLFFSYAERKAVKPISKQDLDAQQHELHAHVMPEAPRLPGKSLWIDFLSFWCVDLRLIVSRIDWLTVTYNASLALAIFAFVLSFAGMAVDFGWLSDLSHVLDRFGLTN